MDLTVEWAPSGEQYVLEVALEADVLDLKKAVSKILHETLKSTSPLHVVPSAEGIELLWHAPCGERITLGEDTDSLSGCAVSGGDKITADVAHAKWACPRDYSIGTGVDGIWNISLSRCGRFCALGLWTSIQIMDLVTGLVVLSVPTCSFRVAMTDLYVVARDNVVRSKALIMDVKTGDVVSEMHNHSGNILSLTSTSCSSYIVSCSLDRTICVSQTTGELLNRIDCDFEPFGMTVSSCNLWFAVGFRTGHVKLYEFTQPECELSHTFTAHENQVISVAFSPCSKVLASGSEDNTVCIYSVAERIQLRKLLHQSAIWCVRFTRCSEYILSSVGMTIRRHHVATGESLGQLRHHTKNVCAVAISPCNTFFVSGGDDLVLVVRDINSFPIDERADGNEN